MPDGKTTFHKKDIADATQIVLNNSKRFPHLQGKIQFDTKFKKVPRDQHGRLTQTANATRIDQAPVSKTKTSAPQHKSPGKGKKKARKAISPLLFDSDLEELAMAQLRHGAHSPQDASAAANAYLAKMALANQANCAFPTTGPS